MQQLGELQAARCPSSRLSASEEDDIHGKLAKRRVFIALPIYGGVDPRFFMSCLRLVQEFKDQGFGGAVKTYCGDSAIGRARNGLTRQFLESDCTHLLFIDSDLVFSLDQIRRLMLHNEPIVGGVYCKKQEGNPQLVLNSCFEPKEQREDGLLEVRYIGTGFMRVAREVFEKMIEKYGEEIRYTCDHDKNLTEHDFWSMGVYKYPDGTRRWLSEDWYFCQRALDLGYKVYADMHVIAKHCGTVEFPLSYQERALFERPVNSGDTVAQGK